METTQGIVDWLSILVEDDQPVVLSQSEVVRLRHDLKKTIGLISNHSYAGEDDMSARVNAKVVYDGVIDVKCLPAGQVSKWDGKRKPGRVLVYLEQHEDWVPHFDVWRLLGWSRWSPRRMRAVQATAPAEVRVVVRDDGKVFLTEHEQAAWAQRVSVALDERPKTGSADDYLEPTETEVARDSAVVCLNSVTVAPFVIEVSR